MVIGDPVEHSLSPTMHNAGYKALGIDGDFVYLGSRVTSKDLEIFIHAMRVMNIRGVSCTMPHKHAVMKHLDVIDPIAEKIGAVNTIVNENNVLTGYNTDWQGIVKPLKQLTELKNKKIAVLGAGGSARAAVHGLVECGAQVICYNRTMEKAEQLAKEFNCTAKPLEAMNDIKNVDIIVATTPNELLNKNLLKPDHIVFDIVYAKERSQLIDDARAIGCRTLSGQDMLLHQGTTQFTLYTGQPAPERAMRRALEGTT